MFPCTYLLGRGKSLFYNQENSPFLGDKHPNTFGKPALMFILKMMFEMRNNLFIFH